MTAEQPILIFDGDCGFCTTSVKFLRRYVKPNCLIIEWQHADLDALGLTAEQCNDAVQWVGVGPRRVRASGGAAIAAALKTGRAPWRAAGSLLTTAPMRGMTELVYRAVARNRYRLPGGTPSCALPAADDRATRD